MYECRQKRKHEILYEREVNVLVDILYLEKMIEKSGKKKGYLAEKLGISRQYFRMKCNNEADFTTREVDILCRELCIVKLSEKEKIFFKK